MLEIGPGEGTLTRALLRRGAVITAIEVDRDLVPGLRDRFPEVRLIAGDALLQDWAQLMGGRYRLTGNIPYQITSPLLEKALAPPRADRIVFLVQKEVADRLTAPPGTRTYGGLAVGVQAVARAERLFPVPAGAFHPPPRVDSAVIRLTPRAQPDVQEAELAPFRRLVTGLFGFRRKQLHRGLRELTGWPAGAVTEVLDRLGLDPVARPEALPPQAFAALTRALVDGGWTGE